MSEVEATAAPSKRRWFRFGLKWFIGLVTGIAILINLALAQPTKEFVSIVRLTIAAAFLVGGAIYLITQLSGTTAWHRWAARGAYVVAAWGVMIVLCTFSYVLGSMLYWALESP